MDKSTSTSLIVEEVIKRYSDMVYKLAYARTRNKHDADDIFQEVFLKYMKNYEKLNDEDHKKAWLIRTTINCTKNLWRSAYFRRTQALEEVVVFDDVLENDLDKKLKELPEKYRVVIHLFYYEDMPISEIEKVLREKESTVRTHLTRARKLLKERIKEAEFDV